MIGIINPIVRTSKIVEIKCKKKIFNKLILSLGAKIKKKFFIYEINIIIVRFYY